VVGRQKPKLVVSVPLVTYFLHLYKQLARRLPPARLTRILESWPFDLDKSLYSLPEYTAEAEVHDSTRRLVVLDMGMTTIYGY
jgi:hypothetical protein